MKTLYLVLAIVGAAVPFAFFAQHFEASGYGLSDFVAALFANGAAGGFAADLLITSLVFWIAMFELRRRGPAPHPAFFIVLNLAIGLSCAFPAYLYARARTAEAG